MRFNKRHGIQYKHLSEKDPKRYDNQCKRCRKPAAYPGQTRDQVREPRVLRRVKGAKTMHKRLKAERRSKKEKLSAAEYKKKVRRETRIKSMRYLAGKGCEECGERDPRCLEYDHKNPKEKKSDIGRLLINGYSWSSPTLRREIRKCRILCASCHRRHTIEQQGYYAHEDIQTELGKLAARWGFKI